MLRSSFLAAALVAGSLGAQTRPMTFLDEQNMRQATGSALSPDGRMMLYTISTPDWMQARRQSDVYLVSLDRGVPSTRQLTFTKDKNETSPKWSRDGSFIAFLSDRDAAGPAPGGAPTGGGGRGAGGAAGGRNQLFVMRLDGGGDPINVGFSNHDVRVEVAHRRPPARQDSAALEQRPC